MINIEKRTLDNGLRVVVHVDRSTPLAAINILFNVGAKNEYPDKTGFAHLFEHLMFGGSKNIPSYDAPLQRVGGDNNAWTNNDVTNYYLTLPADNLETGFWLESDRMLELDFSEKSLEVQRKVVIEEYKQRYLNQPYGDIPLLVGPMAYKVHPYQWPTIGKDISHIENATLDDVKEFFFSHYAPNNAIMVVSGNVDPDHVFKLADKWFGDIPNRTIDKKTIPAEPEQTEERKTSVERNVPANMIHMVYHIGSRTDENFYTTDLLSDVLSNGPSSRLIQSLIKEQQLFSDINAYISGDHHPGLYTVTGRLLPSTSMEQAEQAIHNELDKISTEKVSDYELQKVKNKIESTLVFSEINFLNKAMNLAQFELLDKAENINLEVDKYRAVSAEGLLDIAQKTFKATNRSTLYYHSKG
ncbi:M16 family metallopeptidase [Carboxylicivirga linearis]|uniref:Insulinase family protein n=1 Tax=Carboxylicivirga linearis TaxID=1628157 RepID=A0ABS5K279_9BACT|nr:pitrilysin family protein [Carboxylicivirga linearis]MBS2100616.1 insulinase family protein [Carboxylicivirga linearis]